MKNFRNIVKGIIRYLITFIISIFCPIKDKVVFRSFGGAQYSDNPRAISEKMHELYPNIEIVWILTNVIPELPEYVRAITTKSLKYFYDMATMRCFITNVEYTGLYYKRQGQIFIQTWHGDRGFKKCLYQVDATLDITDNRYTDIYMTGSDFACEFCKSAFRYFGTLTKYGSPRNDILLNHTKEYIANIKHKLNIEDKTKILLYAPTFNDKNVILGKKQTTDLNITRILSILERKYSNRWIALVRAHSLSCGLNMSDSSNKIIDVTNYYDIADLLLISDWLLSDYSSVMGDFILTGKPIVLIDFNRDEFIREARDFCVDIDEVGYKIAHSQNELENMICSLTLEDFKNSCELVKKYYGTHETGEASIRICDFIAKSMR